MAPLLPRMHLFEIDDQPWFPPWFRSKVQAALTIAWTTHIPFLQTRSPAQTVANLLSDTLGQAVFDHVFIDFCAGGGGPTPSIERHLNASLPPSSQQNEKEGVQFVLTDLHPHVPDWKKAAAESSHLSYVPEPVDAANAPADLVGRYKDKGKKVFRLFNLAFHHFDDPLARDILKNTVETSDGFGIFELQDRTLPGLLPPILFGIGILLLAPYYALFVWHSPWTLVFTYLIPVLPFVLVGDGIVSALRTRTPEEVAYLLRTCGAEGGPAEIEKWELKSGNESFMWPLGKVNWIIATRKRWDPPLEIGRLKVPVGWYAAKPRKSIYSSQQRGGEGPRPVNWAVHPRTFHLGQGMIRFAQCREPQRLGCSHTRQGDSSVGGPCALSRTALVGSLGYAVSI